ncbi:MAG TPA: prephenate dehydrogenase/arogenate dehydrogenase family protein [Anaerolineales bacterium]|nr:prephenate dehydrogenase/arogenate dehydrogenase family protein [Anaerolineales bacterium]
MSVQITIIGLGQVGSSIGLALKERGLSIHRVGHDKDPHVAKTALQMGAVDEFKYNLPASVRDAQIILLALPLSGIRETLEVIAPDLREDVVILDTAPAKTQVAAWVKELIPQGRHYVGLSPAAGSGYLHGTDLGVASARADLFKNGCFMINAPHGTPGEAVKLATDLVHLLGAQALLSDSFEVDGLLASAHILPQLAAAALLDATVNQPGWREASKLASRPYATATAALAYHDELRSLSEAALGNRENVVRMLDTYIASLQKLRNEIADGDDKSMLELLDEALKSREQWLQERSAGKWQDLSQGRVEAQSFGERLNQMFFGRLFEREKKRR